MAHIACKSKPRSVWGHTCINADEKGVEIGRAVVYFAPAARTFSVGINVGTVCTVKRQL